MTPQIDIPTPVPPGETRLALVISIERHVLYLRYLLWALGIACYVLGLLSGTPYAAAIITAAVAGHNLFTHWVLAHRRYGLFLRPVNFAFHLATTTVAVAFTGTGQADIYAAFFFLIFGYTIYSRRAYGVVLVTLVCCAAYLMILALEILFTGVYADAGIIVMKLISFAVCGWIVHRLVMVLRLSEQRVTEHSHALEASEGMLRSIFDHAAEPFFVLDEKSFFTEANDGACAFLGVEHEELAGQRFGAFAFDDGTLNNKLAAMRSQGSYRGELLLIAADGEERTVEMRARAFRSQSRTYFACVCRDITEDKETQEANRLANENLARVNAELTRLNELKSAFLTDIARSLSSPLAALLGYIELLLNEDLGPVEEEQHKALLTCRRSALRCFALMESSLEFDVPRAPSSNDNAPPD